MTNKITDADLAYLRNIDTRPGPNAGESIDPTKPGPSKGSDAAEALVERLDQEFLQYRAADVVYAMATLLGYSLARFHEHNIEDTEEAMQAIGELIALSAAQELKRSRT